MIKDNTITQILVCQCESYDHMIHIWYEPSSDENSDLTFVTLSVHLKPHRWYKRIWHAIKYIFGFRSRYGDFDEFIFKPKDYKSLRDVAQYLENIYNKT